MRLPGKGNSNSRGARPVCQDHFADCVDLDQEVVHKDLSLWLLTLFHPQLRASGTQPAS